MDNIEQLKQDNAKLTERLNNAAKFFREQKSQIEALTKENEELKKNQNVVDYDETIKNLQTKLQNTDAAYEQLRTKYVARKEEQSELLGKIEELEKQLKENSQNSQYSDDQISSLNQTISESKKAYDEVLKSSTELAKELAELKVKYKENDIARGEVELKLAAIQTEYADKFAQQEKELSECKENHKIVSDKYDSLHDKYVALKENCEQLISVNATLEADTDTLRKSEKEYREAYAQQNKEVQLVKEASEVLKTTINDLQKENKETEEQFNRVLDTYEKDLKEAKDEYCKLNSLFDGTQNECNRLENELKEAKEKLDIVSKQYDSKDLALKNLQQTYNEVYAEKDELKEKYDKLNIQYDNLENEKLGLENDYNNLKQIHDKLVEETSISSEYERHLCDTLLNIRDLCEDIINPTPISETELKKKIEEGKTIEIPKVKNSPDPKKLIKKSSEMDLGLSVSNQSIQML